MQPVSAATNKADKIAPLIPKLRRHPATLRAYLKNRMAPVFDFIVLKHALTESKVMCIGPGLVSPGSSHSDTTTGLLFNRNVCLNLKS